MQNKGIRQRFLASILGNGIRGFLSLLTAALLARWLGPTDYGRLAFLLVSFTAIRNLLDMASSSAFFTFVSQRQRTTKFIAYYGFFILAQLFFCVVFLLILPGPWVDSIWKGEARWLVMLGFIAAFLQGSVWNMVSQLMESDRKTSQIQFFSTILTLVHLGIITLLWFSSRLGIMAILVALAFEYALASFWVMRLYFRKRKHQDFPEQEESLRTIFSEYARFCKPFIPYTFIGFAYEFGDRWMLQHWGGADQQAYYALATQFATVVLLATASILRILWKEVAEAHYNGNMAKAQYLYQSVSRGVFFLGASLAALLTPWSDQIVEWTLGEGYLPGSTTLMLMFLYPIHQSMGQIGATMLYATGQTRAYTNLGLIFMAISLIVAYFLLAPSQAIIPGLGMGSEGLACKMLGMQFIQVNVIAWLIAKKYHWKFDWQTQLMVLITVISAGWCAKSLVLVTVTTGAISQIIFSSMLTLLVIFVIVYAKPELAGFKSGKLSLPFKKYFHQP